MPSTNPHRPTNEKDVLLVTNGAPMFPLFPGLAAGALIPSTQTVVSYSLGQAPASGVLTSTGAAVNNLTTATPFGQGALNADGVSRQLVGSMAGRTYLVQAVAAGSLMASDSPLVGDNRYWTVALNTTIPPAVATFPGVPLAAGDRCIVIMGPSLGWLQWISTTGTASLVCTELF